ncbi:hypothetical protein LGN17_17500 [Burkholderia sp. AU30280]|nr:hypothetical protein [Burkholderia sp. AU30280]MCA8274289.1 hypothetical protein [Burkholderia sp. AU30280]
MGIAEIVCGGVMAIAEQLQTLCAPLRYAWWRRRPADGRTAVDLRE